jgi:hypothetical protein
VTRLTGSQVRRGQACRTTSGRGLTRVGTVVGRVGTSVGLLVGAVVGHVLTYELERYGQTAVVVQPVWIRGTPLHRAASRLPQGCWTTHP